MNEREINFIADLMNKMDRKAAVIGDIINDYLSHHKNLDKVDFLDKAWGVVRAYARLQWAYPENNWQERVQKFIENGLPDVSAAPYYIQWEIHEWFLSHIPTPESELPALLEKPDIILRALDNRDITLSEMKKEGLNVEPCTQSPYGIILKNYANLKNTSIWKKGCIEIQDEGAQLLSMDIGVKSGDSVFDFCAGAGGKSLILAQIMQNKGLIQAYDITPKKLFELVKRATRAQIKIIQITTSLPKPDKKFDHVLVDAPCSGCGTWRRCPHMRWHLTEKQLKHITRTQSEILNRAQAYVKLGGKLSYATCSLTTDENEKQVENFLQTHPNYKIVLEKRYSPARTHTDGFYLCVMQKTAY